MNKKSVILIIFGITGDLSKRYLLPAIGKIAEKGMLPMQFHIVGVTRKPKIKVDDLLEKTKYKKYIKNHLEIYSMNMDDINDYRRFSDYLRNKEKKMKDPVERLFHFSVPPLVTRNVVEFLGKSSLSKISGTKLLLEKPFGVNLEDAVDLVKHINKYFLPEQVYRVDHYMAKEITQNIIVFRDGNSLFKKTWNKNFIKSIDIIASEEIDIEGRANFYEQTGALRDYIQSHLLQLAALVLMNLPEDGDLKKVPTLRLETLKHLKVLDAKRGQYEGYKKEVDNPTSLVETFVSITLLSGDPRWVGVPITLTTGKALKDRFTEIRISYKKEKDCESNKLFLRLQPEEGIRFDIWAKQPGYEHKVASHHLGFKFREHYDILPEAYEKVLYNAFNSDHSLFTTSDEVLEAWRILDLLQKKWKKSGKDIIIYKKGSTVEDIIREPKKHK